jgi:hypothetical protein
MDIYQVCGERGWHSIYFTRKDTAEKARKILYPSTANMGDLNTIQVIDCAPEDIVKNEVQP